MIVGTVSPRLTPIPVTTPMHTRHSSLTTTKPMPADAPPPPQHAARWPAGRLAALAQAVEPLVERVAGHVGDAERGEQLADDGVGLHLAALQRVDVRADLFVHELANSVAHGEVDVRPIEHAASLGGFAAAAGRA